MRVCGADYIGKTGLRLRDCVQKHLYDISQRAAKPVSNHFNGHNHRGIFGFLVTTIEQCQFGDRSRLAIQSCYMQNYGTLDPHALNSKFIYT